MWSRRSLRCDGAPRELSLYASEGYWTGEGSAFAAVHTPPRRFRLGRRGDAGGELLTKPLTHSGSELHLNFATSAAGSLRVELQDPNGTALPGFSLDDCHELFGDSVDRVVTWNQGADVSQLSGRLSACDFT